MGGSESVTGRQLLHHADFHAPFGSAIQLHVGHEAAHEEDAASAGLEDVLGLEGIGDLIRIESVPFVPHPNDELGGRVERREGELDGHALTGMLTVAVLDGVDDRLADGDADPMNRILVERRHLSHAIAEDLHEVYHVEETRDLQPDQAAAHRHWRARIIQYGCPMSPLTGSALVPRVSRVSGRLRVPGDKSISHRYAMLAAIAHGTSRLHGYAPGADCAATLACLEALGARVGRLRDGSGVDRPGTVITIDGLGPRGLRAPSGPLDAVNSGTSMRLLAGLVAAHPFRSVIVGDASLSRRPMRRVIDPLTKMGASIAAADGRPPLTIDGASLHGISHAPEVPSAQIKSAVLLAGLHAAGRTTVMEPAPTRDHTERALEAFGGGVIRDGHSVSVDGGQHLRAIDAPIPGDISSAVFWLVLAAGTPDSDLVIEGVGLNPTRASVLRVLERAGARIDVVPSDGLGRGERAGEPIGSIRIRHGEPASFEIGPEEVPGLIDELPGLAALAAMLPGISMTVRGARELRVKESDRITMLAKGFGRLGIEVTEYEDGFTIRGGPPRGGDADAAHDHRLAMAFAIAGSRAAGQVHVTGADVVAVSYPGFFDQLDEIARGQ